MKKYTSSYQKLFRATLATTMATGVLVAAVPAHTEAAKSFPDVKPTHHFYEAVLNLTERGVINGYDNGTFRPGENISREHAAKIMALALNLDTKNVVDPGFKDIQKNHPYYGHIAALVNAGIIKGYEDNTFRPKGKLTRAHVAQLLVLGYDFEEEKLSNLPFNDINDKQWFANYIQTLFSNEITTGTTPTTFSPNAFVTRGQVASFIHRSELATTQKGAEVINIADNQIELSEGTYALHADLQKVFNADNLDVLKGAAVKYTVKDGVIVAISSLELNASGTAEENLTLDGKGATFAGDITANGDYIVLKNLTIKGKTSISDKAKSVAGARYSIAAETASPTIIFIDVTMGSVVVTKDGVTIDFKGNTKVSETIISSNVILKADKGVTIPKVTVTEGVTNLTLDVNVDNLSINTTENLTVEGTGNIKEATIESENDVKFDIKGKIDKLNVESKDAKITLGNTKVSNLNLPAGTDAKDIVGDYDKAKGNIENVGGSKNPDAGSSDGGNSGGGGGGGSTTTPTTGEDDLKKQIKDKFNEQRPSNGEVDVNGAKVKLVGNEFQVTIPEGSNYTFADFKDAARPVFTAFNDVTVSKVNSIVISDTVDQRDFEGAFTKIMNRLNVESGTSINYLRGWTVPVNVEGTINGKSFKVQYNFVFSE